MRRTFALLLLCLGLLAVPLHAADPAQLQKIQDDLNAKRAQENDLRRALDKTEDELKNLREKLVKAAAANEKSADTLADLRDKLTTLQRRETQERRNLAEQRAHISTLLVALLRLSRMPPEILLLKPEQPVDNIRGAILLRHALPHYAEEAARLSAEIAALDKTQKEIIARQQDIETTQRNFASQQTELNTLLGERQAWLKATEGQRTDLQQQITQLSAEAQNVQDLLKKVATAGLRLPQPKLKKGGRVAFMAPTKGSLLYGYGQPDDVGSQSRGLMLKVKPNEMIVAPADGTVVFAGPFKGYGNIVILRHGDEYHSFLAGFGRLDATVGQVVNAGEPLGRAAADSGAQAQFYFELRHHGSPINPQPLVTLATAAQ